MAVFHTAASADDAIEVVATGVTNITLTGQTTAGRIDGTNHAGFRLTNVTLAQGSSIGSAILTFDQLANYTGSGTMSQTTLYAEAVDNATQFAASANNISSRSRSTHSIAGSTITASTNVQAGGAGIDVTALVQEIISRSGWVSGNAINFLFIGSGTVGNYIAPFQWDYFSGTYLTNLTAAAGVAASASLVAGANFTGSAQASYFTNPSWQAGSKVTVTAAQIFNSGSIPLQSTANFAASMISVYLVSGSVTAGSVFTGHYSNSVNTGSIAIQAGSVVTADGQIASINAEKVYEYKVFNSSGVYITSLQDVISDYTYSQNIGTPGNAISIELGRTADFLAAITQTLVTQDTSENIDTEASEDILAVTSTGAQIGAGGSIDLNFQIEVWVYYGYTDTLVDETGSPVVDENGLTIAAIVGSPSGLRLFAGYISSFSARYGQNETTVVNCLPYGAELNEYMIKTGEVTTVPYFSQDPSAIMTGIMDSYIAQGGVTGYDASTISTTSTKVSYTFKLQSALEGVKKVLEFAPTDWWWKVDVGTNRLHFHSVPTQPTHTFVLGKTIKDLELTKTMENIINTYYFLGGDVVPSDDTTMIYKKYVDTASKTAYRQKLGRDTDGRVTDLASVDILGNSKIATNKDPRYTGTCTILTKVYDIESIELGQVVAFQNFGNFIDSLQLQIVAINYDPDEISLTLDSVLPQPSKRLEDIKRNLVQVQTQNAPDSPA